MDYDKKLQQLIRDAGRRHDTFRVFSDFLAMAAISISNAVDHRNREAREAEYLQTVKRYEPAEIPLFPQMLATLVDALEDEPRDVLGRLFHELDLGNKWAGQFFTSDPICRMMAAITFGEDGKELIRKRGFVRANEPAAGSGAMVIALAREMLSQDVNYQQHLHVTAVDIDIRAVHMTYLQLSLLHVPAVIVHGNTLSVEEWSHWYTPAHILGGWEWRLRRRAAEDSAHEIIAAPAPAERANAASLPDSSDQPAGPPVQLALF
jgi:hypothetical protein